MILPWARFVPSPNCSSREGWEVDAVVLHHISLPPGSFGGPWVEHFFCNRLDPAVDRFFPEIAHLKVSAHFFVDREGQVTQFVDTDLKAWHAGESALDGEPDVNRFSVGIELEGDGQTPYTQAQYAALRRLLAAVRRAHPRVVPERIVGHEHVAPGRKADPGPLFAWDRVRSGLEEG
ncbi:MAG: 1,6-anhydro-N-acetylmuramyl-L-alanine amidase AmpD [Thermodesulfobacteriota bacterium]